MPGGMLCRWLRYCPDCLLVIRANREPASRAAARSQSQSLSGPPHGRDWANWADRCPFRCRPVRPDASHRRNHPRSEWFAHHRPEIALISHPKHCQQAGRRSHACLPERRTTPAMPRYCRSRHTRPPLNPSYAPWSRRPSYHDLWSYQ